MKIAVYSASLDPITNGHIWVVNTALKMFDKVVVAVSDNPSKKYLFSQHDRADMAKRVFAGNNRVIVESIGNRFVVDFAERVGEDHGGQVCLIKGLRNAADLTYEKQQALVNERFSGIQTFYVACPSDLECVSSSFVKSLMQYENWEWKAMHFVPDLVLQELKAMK